jgi:hypothetical protein
MYKQDFNCTQGSCHCWFVFCFKAGLPGVVRGKQWFAGLESEVAMCCSSDVLITGLNVYASALDQSL